MANFQTELDVINDMLATMGETPLNALDEDHPFVAAGLRELRKINKREQMKGWWYNKEVIELSVQPDTFIYIPNDVLSIDPVWSEQNLVQRGRKLYDIQRATFAYPEDTKVRVAIIRMIPFEDLPPSASAVIGLTAVQNFGRNFDADMQKMQLIQQDRAEAIVTFNTENIRNVQVNFLTTQSMQRRVHALGINPVFGSVLNP